MISRIMRRLLGGAGDRDLQIAVGERGIAPNVGSPDPDDVVAWRKRRRVQPSGRADAIAQRVGHEVEKPRPASAIERNAASWCIGECCRARIDCEAVELESTVRRLE